MKKAFSLLELIFAIVVIGIIASFAVPKYMDTKDAAVISTLKRDIASIVSSVQSYYLINKNITAIQDAITLNSNNWSIEALKVTDKNSCVTIQIDLEDTQAIILTVDAEKAGICTKIRNSGLVTQNYDLM